MALAVRRRPSDEPLSNGAHATSEFEIVERADIGHDAWDAFADASPEAWLWHRFRFCDALGHWTGSKDASFGVRANGRLIAIVPLRVLSRRRLRTLELSYLESVGGPALVDGLGHRLAKRARDRAFAYAQTCARGARIHLRVVLPPLAPALRGEHAPRVNPLLESGLDNTLTQTWIVDLSPGVEALWAGLEGRARTAVRKAEREGVTVRAARADRADLDAYYLLHLATVTRTGVAPHPRAYFEEIWRSFVPLGLADVLMAERDGAIIAARNFGVYKQAAWTWTAAGLDEAGPLGANALLQWEALRRHAGAGVEWSETGEAFPGTSDAKERGLTAFKKSFGGELCPVYRGQMDLRSPLIRRLDALRRSA